MRIPKWARDRRALQFRATHSRLRWVTNMTLTNQREILEPGRLEVVSKSEVRRRILGYSGGGAR